MCSDTCLKITLCQRATEGDVVEFSLSASIDASEQLSGALSLEEVFPSACLSLYEGLQAACATRLRRIVDDQRLSVRDHS